MIINPIQPVQDGDFLEINDMQPNEQVQYLLQHENEVYMLNPQPEEQDLMQLANELHQNQQLGLDLNQAINIPQMQGSPVNYLDEEIPLDQLIGSDDEEDGDSAEHLQDVRIDQVLNHDNNQQLNLNRPLDQA